jgi:predicted nucleic acid-binding protein
VGLIEALGDDPVAVDTSIFIYLIEEHPRFLSHIRPIFQEADLGNRTLVTSALTLLEVLVVPYRAGNRLLARQYEALLARGRGVRLVELTHGQLRVAAELRAVTRMRTPDALQVAAAMSSGCTVFLTSDRRVPSVPGLRVVDLSSFAQEQ